MPNRCWCCYSCCLLDVCLLQSCPVLNVDLSKRLTLATGPVELMDRSARNWCPEKECVFLLAVLLRLLRDSRSVDSKHEAGVALQWLIRIRYKNRVLERTVLFHIFSPYKLLGFCGVSFSHIGGGLYSVPMPTPLTNVGVVHLHVFFVECNCEPLINMASLWTDSTNILILSREICGEPAWNQTVNTSR